MASGTSVLRVILEMVTGKYVAGAKTAATETGKLTDSIGTTAGKLDAMGGALRLAMGSAAVGQVVRFAGQSIDSFSKLNESINAVGLVFGDAKGTILDFAKTAAEQTGLAESEFNQLATTTGAMLTNFGLSAQDAADETINLTQRAADMASVFNVDVNEAMTAIQAALRGESEPIRRFGVSLDDASVKARAVALGLAESTAAVGNQEKAAARLSIIYEQTNKTAGDFVNTSDGLANKQRILAARLENTKAKIGEKLTPAMLDLLEVTEDLTPALATMAGNLADVAADAGAVIGPLGQVLSVLSTIQGFIDGLSGSDNPIAQAFGDAADFVLNPLGVIEKAIDEVQTLLTVGMPVPSEVHDSWQNLGTVTDGVAGALGDVEDQGPDTEAAIKKIGEAADKAAEKVREAGGAMQMLADKMLAQASPVFGAISAYKDYRELLLKIDEDGQRTAEEQLELAEALLGTQAALTELGGGNLDKGIEAIATALRIGKDEVVLLLEQLGILNGTTVTAVIDLQVPKIAKLKPGASTADLTKFLTGLHAGGPVTAGQTYIVGEKGPELFQSNTAGRIIPNHMLGGGGGGTVNMTFQRVEGDNVDQDIQRGVILSGLSRLVETGR